MDALHQKRTGIEDERVPWLSRPEVGDGHITVPAAGSTCMRPDNGEGCTTTAGCPMPQQALIREGAALKAEIEAKTARLRHIHVALSESVKFEGDHKTATLQGAGYRVKVRLNEIISFDQEKILKFRRYLPAEKFDQLFKPVYEPMSKKTIDGFLAHADEDLSAGLRWCMTVKLGAPQVSYEKIEN